MRAKLTYSIAQDCEILITISDTCPADIDAADDLSLGNKEIVEREIAMRYDRVRLERQLFLYRCPNLLGRPSLPLVVKIIDVNQVGFNTLSCLSKPIRVSAVKRASVNRNSMKLLQKFCQRINDREPRFGSFLERLKCRLTTNSGRQQPRLIRCAAKLKNGRH